MNAAHLSIFQKLAAGVLAEISRPESNLGFTYPTITKELLDGGWMPNLIQGENVSYAPIRFLMNLSKRRASSDFGTASTNQLCASRILD